MIHILFFHAFLAPAAVVLPLVVLALEVFLAWSCRSAYRPMLASNVAPDAG